ncbi:uncharacterized protein NMK_3304 [Novimethylophilus kurashikiensis]|uniref:Lysozyme inhibitor LprI-like N-terminal domain-containing protein n=1 Tax=Novimethylophilus kurashikiensis TaxID=1825523 RepID=A0A2R5FGZ4_9PROT|nr:lysozyme inhibitor LprI family protein [Novimethylophilus kurashikiensis]GBG15693.1 uncharacterized protein NMK_3304 [Novimethylophilus kurashikiensis]
MSTAFCRACGKEIEVSVAFCIHCGAAQQGDVGASKGGLPPGVSGWSWGAFLLNWIWAIGNRVWIGLLALIPGVNFIVALILGFKGREWAWEANRWDSVEHFNRVQKKWSFWSVMVFVIGFMFGLVIAVVIPAYHDYQKRAAEVAAEQQGNQVETSMQPVANQDTGSKAFKCEDHKDLLTSADPTIRLVDKVGDIPADLRQALGPDIEKSQLLPQKIPGQYLAICKATAYYYDNQDRDVFYTVSQVNNGTELFVTIQDIGWLKNDLKFKKTITDIVEQQKKEKQEQERQQADSSKQEGASQTAQSGQQQAEPDSPSFDCAKASNNVERMICGDKELQRLDRSMYRDYKDMSNRVDPEQLKKEQNAWLKERNACQTRECVKQAFVNRITQFAAESE